EVDFAPVVSIPGKTLASVDEAGGEVEFSATADYLVRIDAYGDQAGPDAVQMAILIGGEQRQLIEVAATASQPGSYEWTARVEQGKRRVAVKFLNDYYQPDHADPKLRGDRNLHVRSLSVVGPIGVLPASLPQSHTRLIPHRPGDGAPRSELLD